MDLPAALPFRLRERRKSRHVSIAQIPNQELQNKHAFLFPSECVACELTSGWARRSEFMCPPIARGLGDPTATVPCPLAAAGTRTCGELHPTSLPNLSRLATPFWEEVEGPPRPGWGEPPAAQAASAPLARSLQSTTATPRLSSRAPPASTVCSPPPTIALSLLCGRGATKLDF